MATNDEIIKELGFRADYNNEIVIALNKARADERAKVISEMGVDIEDVIERDKSIRLSTKEEIIKLIKQVEVSPNSDEEEFLLELIQKIRDLE